MQYVVVTSKGLAKFAKIAYKKIFNVKRIPKGGIVIVSKGLYMYTKSLNYHQETVNFEYPFEDVYARKREDKTYKILQSFKEEDEVHYFSDVDFGYSQMILWEIHHAFKVPLDKLAAVQKLPNYNKETHTFILGDVYKPYSVTEFEPEMVRRMMALSIIKLSLYKYTQKFIYGLPFNLATFIYIKMQQEFPHDTKHKFRLIYEYTEDFDISSPPMKKSYNVTHPIITQRLYNQMSEDIKGYQDPNFLDHLQLLMTQFVEKKLDYETYKEKIKEIFNIEGEYV